MFSGSVAFAGLQAEVFHAEGSGHANQDRWFAQPFGKGLRVAAIDGVTPWRTPVCPGGDAAEWAASTVLGVLALPLDPMTALRHANELVHRRGVVPSRRQAQAAVAVADCRREGEQVGWSVAVAADCEVWVAEACDAVPYLVCGGDFLEPTARRVWDEQLAARGFVWSFDERLSAEAVLLDGQSTQIRHAVGRYPLPVFDVVEGASSVLLVASDGARIAQAARSGVVVADLVGWLGDVVASAPRDDLTCVIVSPA